MWLEWSVKLFDEAVGSRASSFGIACSWFEAARLVADARRYQLGVTEMCGCERVSVEAELLEREEV